MSACSLEPTGSAARSRPPGPLLVRVVVVAVVGAGCGLGATVQAATRLADSATASIAVTAAARGKRTPTPERDGVAFGHMWVILAAPPASWPPMRPLNP